MESSHNFKAKEFIEVKDRWVKVRGTTDSGAAGHVMPETMFPRVKLERKTSSKKIVAANGDESETSVKRKFRSKQKREFRGAQRSGVRVLSSLSFPCKR